MQLATLDVLPRSFDRLLYVLSTHRKPQYSTPTRIAEAVPYLEEVIAYYKRQNPNKVDDTPEMYLGVALHKQPGQEEAAIAHFREAYAASPAIGMQYSTQLWSRACFSRLLRRIGKIQDAEEQEDDIRYVLCQRERCCVLTGTGQRLAPLAPIRDAAQRIPRVGDGSSARRKGLHSGAPGSQGYVCEHDGGGARDGFLLWVRML